MDTLYDYLIIKNEICKNEDEWTPSDPIPLDPLIKDMVFFLRRNGVETTNSCQGGNGHFYGCPTIRFNLPSGKELNEIDRIYRLLAENNLDLSVVISWNKATYFTNTYSNCDEGEIRWLWKKDYKNQILKKVIKINKDHHGHLRNNKSY